MRPWPPRQLLTACGRSQPLQVSTATCIRPAPGRRTILPRGYQQWREGRASHSPDAQAQRSHRPGTCRDPGRLNTALQAESIPAASRANDAPNRQHAE